MSFTDFLATWRAERGRLTRSGQRIDSGLCFDDVLRNAGAALPALTEDLPTPEPRRAMPGRLTLVRQGGTPEHVGP